MISSSRYEEDGVIVRASFAMAHGGGMIWIADLDGLGDRHALVRAKFDEDMQTIRRPSSPSGIVLHVKDTVLDDALTAYIGKTLADAHPQVRRVAVVGMARGTKSAMRQALAGTQIAFSFFTDLEAAKDWSVRDEV